MQTSNAQCFKFLVLPSSTLSVKYSLKKVLAVMLSIYWIILKLVAEIEEGVVGHSLLCRATRQGQQ